jgi:murein endopeptidase
MVLPGTPNHETIETNLRWMHAELPFPTTKISSDLSQLFAPGLAIGNIVMTSGDCLHREGGATSSTGLSLDIHLTYRKMARQCGVTAPNFVHALLGT